MAEDDRVDQSLHSKFKEAFGEPEATEVMNRLISAQDLRMDIVLLKHEMELFEQRIGGDLRATEERLRAEIQGGLRKQMATILTVLGILNGVVFAALGLVLS